MSVPELIERYTARGNAQDRDTIASPHTCAGRAYCSEGCVLGIASAARADGLTPSRSTSGRW